ncbi:MAG: hypothetical protein ACI8P0_006011 [Planctomycetaceae bacterium]|jgi:hypothetical protein
MSVDRLVSIEAETSWTFRFIMARGEGKLKSPVAEFRV